MGSHQGQVGTWVWGCAWLSLPLPFACEVPSSSWALPLIFVCQDLPTLIIIYFVGSFPHSFLFF